MTIKTLFYKFWLISNKKKNERVQLIMIHILNLRYKLT